MNSAPVITALRTNATFQTLIPLSSMFDAFDPDFFENNIFDEDESLFITRYRLRDQGFAGGQFVRLAADGSIEETFASGVTFTITPDEVDSIFYFNDNIASSFSETFSIEAFDGIDASDFSTNQIFANPNFGFNTPPLLTARDQVVPINGQLAFAEFFTLDDLENNVETISVRDNGTGGGFFTLNGNVLAPNVFHEIRINQVDNVVYNGANRRTGETFTLQAFDGDLRSLQVSAPVFTGNSRPVVSSTDSPRVTAANSIAASEIFNVSDADNDTITSYFIADQTTNVDSGFWELDGIAQPAGSFFRITPAELSVLRFVGGFPGGITDTIAVQAFDGSSFSEIQTLPVRTSAPSTIVGNRATVLAGETVLASTLFDVVDADSDSPVSYFITDRSPAANSGHFELDGNRLASASFVQLNAAQFSRLVYRGGTVTRSENIGVQVFDGFEFSEISNFVVTTTSSPTLSLTDGAVFPSRSINVSSLVNFQDADGEAAVEYRLLDRFAATNTGNFELDGNRLPSGTFFNLTAAEFERLEYIGGSFGTFDEQILISASDGTSFSEVESFNITTLENANAPVLQAFSVNGRRGATVDARSLFSFFDAEGDTLSTVTFTDNSAAANGNFFAIDGVEQPAQRSFTVDFSLVEAGRVTYTLGQTGVTETFRINASDGTNTGRQVSSTGTSFVIPQIAANPVTGNDLNIETIDRVEVSSLITQTDGGPPLDRYQVFDPNTESLSGGFELDGEALQQGIIHQLNAAQFSRLVYVGAEVDNGRQLDPILVQGGNALGFSDFIRLNITTDQIAVAQSSGEFNYQPSPNQVAGRPLEITYTFIDGGEQSGGTPVNPNVPPLPVYYLDVPVPDRDEALNTRALNRFQREDIRDVLDNVQSYANITFTEVAYDVTAADAQITFGAYEFRSGGSGLDLIGNIGGTAGTNNGFGEIAGDIWFDVGAFDPNTFTDVGNGTEFRQSALSGVLFSLHSFIEESELSIFNNFEYNAISSDNNGTFNDPFPAFPEAPSTLQLYDVITLQEQYGANTNFNIDNNQYFFNDGHRQTLWDAGGIDTINFQARTANQLGVFNDTIDLRQGQFSSINGIDRSLRIAYGAVIENARGGDGDDSITGNETANRLFGNGGNDTITGGGGNDALIGGNGDDTYTWSLGDGRDLITERSTDGSGGTDLLIISDPSNSLNSLEDDLTFRRLGNDLRIDLTLDQGAGQGTVTIRNFANAAERVELLRLVDISGNSIGNDISLNSIFENADTTAQRFQVTSNVPSDPTLPGGDQLGIATPV